MQVHLLTVYNKWKFLTFVLEFLASRYGAVLIPSALGALHDLAQDSELAKLLNTFVHEKSG